MRDLPLICDHHKANFLAVNVVAGFWRF